MEKPKRLRREDPIRKGPIRNASTYFRKSNSWNDQASEPEQTQADGQRPFDSMDDVVTNGVKLGYEVIEKYILQGRKVAEQLRNGSHEKNSKEENYEWLLSSMFRLNRDIAGFWIDAIETFVRNPDFLVGLIGSGRSNGATPSSNDLGESGNNATAPTARVTIEIESSRRAQVTLDLRPGPTQGIPHVHALHAPDSAIPPLTDVSLRIDSESATPIVHLKIPDKQPAALYTGVVLDQNTNEVRGTLCVRVQA